MRPRFINILLCCLLLASCSDDTSEWLEPEPEQPDRVKLTLRLPGFKTASRASVDDNSITSLQVLFFDGAGKYLSETGVEQSKITGSGSTYEVTLPILPTAASVQLVANFGGELGGDAAAVAMTGDPNSRADIVFFGEASLASLEKENPSVTLTRSVARTEIIATAPDFEIEKVRFYGTPSKGLVGCEQASAPNLPAGISYAAEGADMATDGTPYYHYEAEAGKCSLVIKGSYKGVSGWYKVGYIPASDEDADKGEEVALLRNHRYRFTITGVTDSGWATEKEAAESKPDNRLVTDLRDDTPDIYNIVACRDYMLGVSEDVRVACNAESAELHIITSFPAKAGSPQYTVTIDKEDAEWVTGCKETASGAVDEGGTQSACTEYTLTFGLKMNDRSEFDRETTVEIRSGDLVRTVRIIQDGTDFKRDPTRRVMIHGLEYHDEACDYFDFIDKELQGATAEEMRVARNNGLHFRVCDNSYYYTIPIKDGDEAEVLSGIGKIELSRENGNWVIRCTDNTDYSMWTGRIRISNSGLTRDDLITVTYDVFHLGLFHRLTGQYQIPGPDESRERSGWFYYEQVKVTGTDGKDYYVLDRNMAATGNKFYSLHSSFSQGNVESRGGYFKIADNKNDTHLIDGLPPKGFSIPEAYQLQQLGIYAKNDEDGTVALNVTEGELKEVYFPGSGYMEGSIHKDDSHTCIWSRTLLSGAQGFAEDSPEYGYWFMYLDVYGQSVSLGNMRLATRSSISPDGIGAYKAMPVRCIMGPEPPVGWNIPKPAEGRRRVILLNLAVDKVTISWNNGYQPEAWPDMYDCGGNALYYDIPAVATEITVDNQKGYRRTFTLPDGEQISTIDASLHSSRLSHR